MSSTADTGGRARGFWRRLRDRDEPSPAAQPSPPAASGDSPEELRRAVAELVRFVNARSGDLPPAAVVNARRLTDLLREVVDTSEVRPLDVYAVMSVQGTATDYLPTTLRGYLAVDEALRDVPRGSGHTPTQALLIQIDTLTTSVEATLDAVQHQDADALMTQGAFLRTKFARSDLDL
ncbi:hypothetical protein [Cellulomonas biazotea]|uniref:Uncharacterized protein n=1 Tax=Cellulomonas biazotea TaxID=1709 RepID=A0A402DPY6_9CELL|nr:hypothetical protein [Cellulomonas biazotea]GCE76193.1 hypothetical protein CBZ_12490 [Cellulomonas biazotea]